MDLIQFLGRFHVLLLHLPIGILLMAACLEIYWVYKKQPRNPLIKVVWLWGAISAAGAALLGYLLSLGGGYNEEAIATHRNWAISVILCSFFCWFFLGRIASKTKTKGKIIASLSALQLFLLFLTGHYGANMTHGETFLVEHAPDFVKKIAGLKVSQPVTSVEAAQIYPDVIEPMFANRCSACHNNSKTKGRLNLATYETTMQEVVVANNLERSELYKRITLDSHHEEYMPAEGKTPLTPAQVELIAWWINTGAKNQVSVETLNPPSEVYSLIEEELKLGQYSEIAQVQVDEITQEIVEELEQSGFHISRIQQNQPFVSVIYADIKEPFDDKKLETLLKAKEQIKWLKLAKSSVTDEQVTKLAELVHLSKLDLSHTDISSEGIDALLKRPKLTVNTYNTQVQ